MVSTSFDAPDPQHMLLHPQHSMPQSRRSAGHCVNVYKHAWGHRQELLRVLRRVLWRGRGSGSQHRRPARSCCRGRGQLPDRRLEWS